jgi:chaperonin GroES
MFKPVGNWIAVKRDEKAKKIGSLYVPETADKSLPTGEVVAIGPGEVQKNGERYQFSVKVGDRVIFSKNVGEGQHAVEITTDGMKVVMLKEEVIYGVIS